MKIKAVISAVLALSTTLSGVAFAQGTNAPWGYQTRSPDQARWGGQRGNESRQAGPGWQRGQQQDLRRGAIEARGLQPSRLDDRRQDWQQARRDGETRRAWQARDGQARDWQARDWQARGSRSRDGQSWDQRSRDSQARDRPARDWQARDWQARDGQARDGQPRDDERRGARPEYRFHEGGRLPGEYRGRQYVVDDWRGHSLNAPPRGYHWVRAGGDYLLVAIATGIIASVLLNQ